MPTVKELIEELKEYPPDRQLAFSTWIIEDVMYYYDFYDNAKNRPPLTTEQANNILERFHNNFDAEQGLTWNTLGDAMKIELEKE